MAEQHAVVLRAIVPGLPIWRRLEVPARLDLAALHRVVLAAFDWGDVDLHRFGRGGWDAPEWIEARAEGDLTLEQAFPETGTVLLYQYGPPPTWSVELHGEGFVAVEGEAHLPRCTDGERAAPPEDWAGPQDYLQRLEVLADAPVETDADAWEAQGAGMDLHWDPERFHPDLVNPRMAAVALDEAPLDPADAYPRLVERLETATSAWEDGEPAADDLGLVGATLDVCPSRRTFDALARDVHPDLAEWIRAVLEAHVEAAEVVEPSRRFLALTGDWRDGVQLALALTHQDRADEGRATVDRFRDQAVRVGDGLAFEAAAALQRGLAGDAAGAERTLRDLLASEPDPFLREPAAVTLADLLEGTGREAEAERLLAEEEAAMDAQLGDAPGEA